MKSRLEGLNITAHGGKIIHACLREKVFVGFNSLPYPEGSLKGLYPTIDIRP